MRRVLMWAAAGLTPLLWQTYVSAGESAKGAPASAVKPADKDDDGCHGTAVHFVDTPSIAARQALKEQKLVFVLHVSGHFEDPGVT